MRRPSDPPSQARPLKTRGAGAYARAIEAALSRLLERPRLLSPREWALVADWHARGIPLAMVLEVLEDVGRRRAAGRRGSSSSLRSVAYIAPALEEAWRTLREGRTAAAPSDPAPLPERRALGEAWEMARRSAPPGSALEALLADLCRRRDAGDPPAALDAALDAAIESAAPSEAADAAEEETIRALRPFRSRMSSEDFEKTARRARIDRLRAALGLPRLVLSR